MRTMDLHMEVRGTHCFYVAYSVTKCVSLGNRATYVCLSVLHKYKTFLLRYKKIRIILYDSNHRLSELNVIFFSIRNSCWFYFFVQNHGDTRF